MAISFKCWLKKDAWWHVPQSTVHLCQYFCWVFIFIKLVCKNSSKMFLCCGLSNIFFYYLLIFPRSPCLISSLNSTLSITAASLFVWLPYVWWELWWEVQMLSHTSVLLSKSYHSAKTISSPLSFNLSLSARIELYVLLTPQFHGYYLSWDSKIWPYPFEALEEGSQRM